MKASIDNLYVIILAAGASRRMGSIKQLLEWQNQSLLEHAIRIARTFLNGRVIVVLGAHAETIQAAIDLNNVSTIFNPDWQEGIASSIRMGIQALPETATAALILLSDQPLIRPNLVQNLLTGWQNEPARIVACQYGDSVGVPVIFPAGYFRRLLELKGDQGAKRLLLEFDGSLLKIPLPEAPLDIDTICDFNHLTLHYSAEE